MLCKVTALVEQQSRVCIWGYLSGPREQPFSPSPCCIRARLPPADVLSSPRLTSACTPPPPVLLLDPFSMRQPEWSSWSDHVTPLLRMGQPFPVMPRRKSSLLSWVDRAPCDQFWAHLSSFVAIALPGPIRFYWVPSASLSSLGSLLPPWLHMPSLYLGCFMANRWENSGNSGWLYWLQPWN